MKLAGIEMQPSLLGEGRLFHLLQGVQRKMVLVVNFFVFLELLLVALVIYVT